MWAVSLLSLGMASLKASRTKGKHVSPTPPYLLIYISHFVVSASFRA